MIDLINESWGWVGLNAVEIFSVNDFGNVLCKDEKGKYWRISPEELSCAVVAADRAALSQLMNDPEFLETWESFELINEAQKQVGDLDVGEKYCLKLPLVLGGLFEAGNLGKLDHKKLIQITGEMAKQIQGLSEEEKLRLVIR